MNSNKRILITSALPYVNNTPHLGTIVGCLLPADILARYYKMCDREVLFICGADEYGSATELKALEENMSPRELCDKYYEIHKNIYKWFNIDFTHFGRTSTTNPATDEWYHTQISQSIFNDLSAGGYISYEACEHLFSSRQNKYLADRFIIGGCPNCGFSEAKGDQCDKCGNIHAAIELIQPIYKLHPAENIIKKISDHYYLDLPRLENKIKSYFTETLSSHNQNTIDITNTWFNVGLKKRCISRDATWGTPICDNAHIGNNKIMYNWFDAPIGYMSITADYFKTDEWKKWWCDPENVHYIAAMGVDNIAFHTIMFMGTLLGTTQPYTKIANVLSSNFLDYDGKKFSKSEGTGIFCDTVCDISAKLNINEDYWRYYLIKIRPETKDSSFKWDDFCDACNNDLVNNYGNCVNRCFSLIQKYLGSKITFTANNPAFDSILGTYHEHIGTNSLKCALQTLMNASSYVNKFLQDNIPWKHVSDLEYLNMILGQALWMIYRITLHMIPFIPHSAEKILSIMCVIDACAREDTCNKFIISVTPFKCIMLDMTKYVLPFVPLKLDAIMNLI